MAKRVGGSQRHRPSSRIRSELRKGMLAAFVVVMVVMVVMAAMVVMTAMMVIAALVVVMVVMAAMGAFFKVVTGVVGTTTRIAVGMVTFVMGLEGDHDEACPQLAWALGALDVTQMQCEQLKGFARRIVGITRISEVVVDRLRQDVDLCLI